MQKKHDIWIVLANLFFLDTEQQEEDYQYALKLLKEAKWTHEQTYKCLVEIIAPYGGVNLGNLIYPVIGEWAGFDESLVIKNCKRIERRREKLPKWLFYFRDRHSKWMLKELDVDRLLDKL